MFVAWHGVVLKSSTPPTKRTPRPTPIHPPTPTKRTPTPTDPPHPNSTKKPTQADVLVNMFRSLMALSPPDVLPAVYLSSNKLASSFEVGRQSFLKALLLVKNSFVCSFQHTTTRGAPTNIRAWTSTTPCLLLAFIDSVVQPKNFHKDQFCLFIPTPPPAAHRSISGRGHQRRGRLGVGGHRAGHGVQRGEAQAPLYGVRVRD